MDHDVHDVLLVNHTRYEYELTMPSFTHSILKRRGTVAAPRAIFSLIFVEAGLMIVLGAITRRCQRPGLGQAIRPPLVQLMALPLRSFWPGAVAYLAGRQW